MNKCLLVFIFVCLLKWTSLSIVQDGLELSNSSEISASGRTVESTAGMCTEQAWFHLCLQVVFYKSHIFVSCFLVILVLNRNCFFMYTLVSLANRIGLVTEEDTIRTQLRTFLIIPNSLLLVSLRIHSPKPTSAFF